MRVSVPQEKVDKFKEVLLYILNKVGAKPNVGRTVVYKLLYFMDFDYYEQYEEQLIGARYQKNQYGPTPMEFTKIVQRMEQDGDLTEVKNKYFERFQTKYLARTRASSHRGCALPVVRQERHGDQRILPWRCSVACYRRWSSHRLRLGVLSHAAVFSATVH
jgi:hypothetical protein